MFSDNAFARKKVKKIEGANGVMLSPTGLTFDASYDPRLDTLVPGYKVINVALFNKSFNIISLDPKKDKWEVKLVSQRKPVRGFYNLRRQDPKAWNHLPDKLHLLITYPLALAIGAEQVVNIFIPSEMDLSEFSELHIYLHSLRTQFTIIMRD